MPTDISDPDHACALNVNLKGVVYGSHVAVRQVGATSPMPSRCGKPRPKRRGLGRCTSLMVEGTTVDGGAGADEGGGSGAGG